MRKSIAGKSIAGKSIARKDIDRKSIERKGSLRCRRLSAHVLVIASASSPCVLCGPAGCRRVAGASSPHIHRVASAGPPRVQRMSAARPAAPARVGQRMGTAWRRQPLTDDRDLGQPPIGNADQDRPFRLTPFDAKATAARQGGLLPQASQLRLGVQPFAQGQGHEFEAPEVHPARW